MFFPNRATFEYHERARDYESDPDPTGCLAEARFSLESALEALAIDCPIIAACHIQNALTALPGGES